MKTPAPDRSIAIKELEKRLLKKWAEDEFFAKKETGVTPSIPTPKETSKKKK